MKISFVIPAYNEEEYIGQCLDAVLREVGTRTDCEVIVVDNNSTDGTNAVVTKKYPRVKLIHEARRGANAAREAGSNIAQGELVAFPDADTAVPSGWLARAEKEFEKNKNLVAISGPFIYYDLPTRIRAFVKTYYYLTYFIYLVSSTFFGRTTVIQGGNYMARRSALKEIGGHNANITFYGDDTDLAVRLSKVGKVKFSLKMKTLTSGRRLAKEGVFTMGVRYTMNNIWMVVFRRPYTTASVEVRLKNNGPFYDPDNKFREFITGVLFIAATIIFFGGLAYIVYRLIAFGVFGALKLTGLSGFTKNVLKEK